MALEPPDSWHLSFAQGWLGLGLVAEAEKELSLLASTLVGHPEVLSAHWQVYAARSDWENAAAVADRLLEAAPEEPNGWIQRAYAARRRAGGGLRLAWEALYPAVERFPREPIIPFNLACYACQLGEHQNALNLLITAMRLGNATAIKKMALADPDLQPVREDIEAIPLP